VKAETFRKCREKEGRGITATPAQKRGVFVFSGRSYEEKGGQIWRQCKESVCKGGGKEQRSGKEQRAGNEKTDWKKGLGGGWGGVGKNEKKALWPSTC